MSARVLGGLVSLATLMGLLAPAGLGASSPATDLAIGPNRWETVGEGIANATGRHQTIGDTLKPGRETTFAVKVTNREDVPRAFTLSGTAGDERFEVTYLDQGWNDVTAQFVAGAYVISVDATARAFVWIRITAAETTDTGDAYTVLVRGQDEADATSFDVVRARVEVPPLSVWGVNYKGTLRCIVTFPRRTLRPGFRTGARFQVTNITDRKLDVYGIAHLIFRDAAGTALWDSAVRHGPIPGPGTLRPGETVELFAFDARVRWSGPLTVEPVCGIRRLQMPSVSFPVRAPGFTGTAAEAIAAAVAEPGSPFQVCPPGTVGEAATGTFPTPDGRDLPPLTLRCWAEVRQEDGFAVVSLNLVSPQDAPDLTIDESSGFPFGGELPGEDNMLALRWSFVVSDAYVRPYLSRSQARALGEGEGVFFYQLHRGQWFESGWSICGVESFGLSTDGESLLLDWITGCSGPATERQERRVTVLPGPDGRTLRT